MGDKYFWGKNRKDTIAEKKVQLKKTIFMNRAKEGFTQVCVIYRD